MVEVHAEGEGEERRRQMVDRVVKTIRKREVEKRGWQVVDRVVKVRVTVKSDGGQCRRYLQVLQTIIKFLKLNIKLTRKANIYTSDYARINQK